jgi:hypothetical protein
MELYTQHQENIITHLETTGAISCFPLLLLPTTPHPFATGISAPMIVDIDWRLDYSIRSKHGGRNNIPMYFVCLKVKDRGLIRNVEMIASLEEMQDLLSSVRTPPLPSSLSPSCPS